jgi:hydrogenase maturation protease
MPTLRDELRRRLAGRVCLVGVGNPDRGDDAFGLRLAEAVRDRGHADVILAERTPERWTDRLARGGFQSVVFLDAVGIEAAPGDVIFLAGPEIAARYPQVSTHKLSLGTIARLIEAAGPTRVFLLGAQPYTVAHGAGLSAPLRRTLETLRDLLVETLIAVRVEPVAACGERS